MDATDQVGVVALCDHLDEELAGTFRVVTIGERRVVALCEFCSNALVGELVQEVLVTALPSLYDIARRNYATEQQDKQLTPRERVQAQFQQRQWRQRGDEE